MPRHRKTHRTTTQSSDAVWRERRARTAKWREREVRTRALVAQHKAEDELGLGEDYTRLDTMKPFHPDDIERIEREAARLRRIVLCEGIDIALKAVAKDPGLLEMDVFNARQTIMRPIDRPWRDPSEPRP